MYPVLKILARYLSIIAAHDTFCSTEREFAGFV